ncbi:beta-lactamase family protein [Shinella daejeonensis]|uniref:serine hydrolase domain-containing protein n=1 Tax=Shinella daejeonensis TaxID=659017 RepID=UPI0020C81B64|nr:serine hydrolase domain-containing protein [Shinella daejeonensis]MCP8896219.1 beta-lactamase family protein [Shinella daejeonensis]
MMTRIRDMIRARTGEPGPGAAIGIWREGRPVLCEGYGHAVRGGHPIGVKTVFDTASVSKMFTALCVLILERRRLLSIDDPLADLLPQMRTAAPGVTIRHLLNHVSALPDYMELFDVRGWGLAHRLGMDATLEVLAAQPPPAVRPGTRYSYSNSGYVLLSAIVERMSGQTLARFAQENVFAPLGMNHSCYVDAMPAQMPALARSYESAEGPEVLPMWEMTGDGQVYSTAEDLGRWALELMRPSLFADLIPQLCTPATLADGSRTAYGAGMQLETLDERPVFGHDGGWAGFRSSLLVAPDAGLGIALLANRADFATGELARSILLELLAASDGN